MTGSRVTERAQFYHEGGRITVEDIQIVSPKIEKPEAVLVRVIPEDGGPAYHVSMIELHRFVLRGSKPSYLNGQPGGTVYVYREEPWTDD